MLGMQREYRTYDVQNGELPADPGECTAYVITGSSAGVYDDRPWIPTLARLPARGARPGQDGRHLLRPPGDGAGVRRRGEKSPKGWGLGLHRYEIVEPPPSMREPSGLAIPAFHQDQVVTLPPGARVLAASEFTPYAAIGYDDDTVSVQGHPEFTPAFSAALIEAQREVYGAAATRRCCRCCSRTIASAPRTGCRTSSTAAGWRPPADG